MLPLMTTLGDFISAGLRPRTPLAKAISLALLMKLCVVVAMRIFLFGADVRPHLDEPAIAKHLLGASTNQRHQNHD